MGKRKTAQGKHQNQKDMILVVRPASGDRPRMKRMMTIEEFKQFEEAENALEN